MRNKKCIGWIFRWIFWTYHSCCSALVECCFIFENKHVQGVPRILKIFLGGHQLVVGPLLPCFGFLVIYVLGFQSQAGSLVYFITYPQWILQIHLWRDTSWPFNGLYGSRASFDPLRSTRIHRHWWDSRYLGYFVQVSNSWFESIRYIKPEPGQLKNEDHWSMSSLLNISCSRAQQYLWEGNVFTGVCLSKGGGVSQHAIGQGVCTPASNEQSGVWPLSVWPRGCDWGCDKGNVTKEVCEQGERCDRGGDVSHGLTPPIAVKKLVVCILLECFLVHNTYGSI